MRRNRCSIKPVPHFCTGNRNARIQGISPPAQVPLVFLAAPRPRTMLRRAALTGAGALGAASAGAAYVYRPQPWADPPEDPLSERTEDGESFLMKASRVFTFGMGTASFSFLMHVLNKFELKDDEHYATLVEVIKDRPPGVPLLTVANHTSPLDDPGVLVGMLPAWLCARPHLMRWTLCAQEICFKMTAAEVAFGSAKVLPVSRGSGVDQRALLNFYRRLLTGQWCHIFPEGHCEQDGFLGGRAPGPSRDKLGRFKWGVGKMIAHAPIPPIVIPIFHTGMSNLMPIDPFTRKILHPVPRSGHTVTARVGPTLQFDDLLEEHERRHGPLRKLAGIPGTTPDGGEGGIAERQDNAVGGKDGSCRTGPSVVLARGEEGDIIWRSTSEERQLYSRIARRVEGALLQLEAEARRDLGEAYPNWPDEAAAMMRLAEGQRKER